MDIVLIHLGWPVPGHLAVCAAQVRAVSGRDAHIVDPRRGAAYRTRNLKRFRRIEYLSHMGLDGFWRYAAERFFVLEAFMRETGLEPCIHIESDNLIYVPTSEYEGWMRDVYGRDVAVTPLNELEDTGSVLYAGSISALSEFNSGLLELLALGRDAVLERHGGEMANEMRMLHILRTEFALSRGLPTTIAEAKATESRWVFDPASYGQFVDGTHSEPGVSFAGDHHVVGREFLSGRYELGWADAPRAPWIEDREGSRRPIVNLHIHSKRLERWASAPAPASLGTPMRPPRWRDGRLAARLARVRGRLTG